MRRTSWFRPIAVLLAVWFPLIVGEPGVVHACPTHGAAVVAPPTSQHAATGGAEHHHGSAAQQSHESAPSHDHHNCTCISCCTGSVAAPATPVAVTTVVVARYETRTSRPVQSRPSLAPEFSRPYPTGPPRV